MLMQTAVHVAVHAVLLLTQADPSVPATSPDPTPTEVAFNWIGPIAGTGLVGVFFLMIVLRIKIMPTYVYDDAKKEWERERGEKEAALEEARRALTEGQKVYSEQVIPTLTRALDAERELLDLRREDARRRGDRT